MQSLFNFIATVTRTEIAFVVVMALILAMFLVPMYITHCTGRKLPKDAFGRYARVRAAREWLLGRFSLMYIVHVSKMQAGISRWQGNDGNVIEIRFGRMSFSLTLVPRPQLTRVRRSYREATGKPVFSWWQRHVSKHHRGY